LAAALEDGLGLSPELIEGDDGVFDIAVDGDVVFSKQASGDFIPTQEMVALVSERVNR
jgi:hypothetical protein